MIQAPSPVSRGYLWAVEVQPYALFFVKARNKTSRGFLTRNPLITRVPLFYSHLAAEVAEDFVVKKKSQQIDQNFGIWAN